MVRMVRKEPLSRVDGGVLRTERLKSTDPIPESISAVLLPCVSSCRRFANTAISNLLSPACRCRRCEVWRVEAFSTSGVDCGLGSTGNDENAHPVPLTFSSTYHFLDFSSTNGNVLLSQLSVGDFVEFSGLTPSLYFGQLNHLDQHKVRRKRNHVPLVH
jgi:hypothetical protein